MVDLKAQYLKIKEEVDKAVLDCFELSSHINGPAVDKFAGELAEYLDTKHVIPCANGTDALQIAMMALGLKRGDEVIVPTFTYVATAEVIALLGLKPVMVDVDPDTFMLNLQQVVSKIGPRTKAVVPVHLYGQCAGMEELMDIARQHNLFVIEDTAQAIGSRYTFSDGSVKAAGTIGHVGCTSFFPSKNLGCFGDGGAIFTEDDTLAEKMRMIANHGQKKKYYHDVVGVNSRLDTIQAAILRIKLQRLDEYAEARNKVAGFYDSSFSNIRELVTPVRSASSSHVFHQYTIKVKNGKRNELKDFLASRNIPSMIYYPLPLNEQKAYATAELSPGSFPVAETLCKEVLSLPIHTEMSEEQLEYIAESVKQFFDK
ncbi:aminotransferase class I/II-fold pyridoxal phosphate-dependent enzyme [Chitinophaga sp. ysch24]|uniref:Aminotransferase class I/II-fold pyridoxal phosphate-dependent enzyme n=2 Tax=Chitinophaga tropicalis TaxID=2683588 RepID=A0A7K1U3G5_9BACT|nr:aminotransferase class I/II-fold pyridoxal phosphate-dependent enzyme [Chitinophaga tropicalis]